jgi:cell division protein FtsI/penicillin-binding protein 2
MSNRARRARARRVIAIAAGGVLVGAGTTSCFAEPSALPTMRDFLIAWQVGNVTAAAGKTTGAPRDEVAAALAQVKGQLDAADLRLALGAPVQEGGQRFEGQAIQRHGDTADARFSVKVDLGENGQPWTYTGLMHLKRINGVWKVQWDPSIIHPSLKKGQRLAVVTEAPPRAPVQDSSGRSLLRKVPASIVGVYPGQLRDPARTVDQIVRATRIDDGQLDNERLLGRIRSAPPNEFLPLLTLERPRSNRLIRRLQPIEDLRFRNVMAPIAAAMANEVVGTLGPATADRLQQVGAPYQIGDTIGATGLQLIQQRWLAGIPTVRVVAQDPDGRQRQELRAWQGQDPQPVRTTLDRRLQPRAERALSGLRMPASMVVVRPGIGEVLAVANHLTRGRNRAMEAQYPPGLAFGIVSAQALLNGGMAQDARTECPPSATVGGRTFTNPGRVPRARSTLQIHFAYSCATTLASLSGRLTANALLTEAGRFGLGKDWGLSLPAFSGTVPTPRNDAEKAALMLGQGVEVSPLAMALVAGAIETGIWRPPYLLTEPRDPQKSVAAQPLNPIPTSDMRKLLRRSVHEGNARSANVSGSSRVSGVAAVAEADGKPVSWFVGSRGDLAFAIAVEGRVDAAALARGFLTGVPAAQTTSAR